MYPIPLWGQLTLPLNELHRIYTGIRNEWRWCWENRHSFTVTLIHSNHGFMRISNRKQLFATLRPFNYKIMVIMPKDKTTRLFQNKYNSSTFTKDQMCCGVFLSCASLEGRTYSEAPKYQHLQVFCAATHNCTKHKWKPRQSSQLWI